MKRKHILIGIIVLVLAVSYIIGMNYKPTSVTYKITGDFSSSGVQKSYLATIVFNDNNLVTAREKYSVLEGDGCKENCKYEYECSNGTSDKWEGNNETCKIDNYVPLSRKEIEKKITSSELKPISSCAKGDLCYEFPPENDLWAGWY